MHEPSSDEVKVFLARYHKLIDYQPCHPPPRASVLEEVFARIDRSEAVAGIVASYIAGFAIAFTVICMTQTWRLLVSLLGP